jgi:hypothetical protein
VTVRPDDVDEAPKTLRATLLGSLIALGTCEILRAVRFSRAPLTHEAGLLDYAHATLATLFMTTTFGSLVLAWQVASRSLVKALALPLTGWLGTKLANVALRAWFYVGLPTLLFGWLMMKGTRAWNPSVSIWLLFGVGFVVSIPFVWLLERALRSLELRARGRRGLVVVSTAALLALGAVAWAGITATFGLRYGKSHLVTFALFVIGCSVVLGHALRALEAPVRGRAWAATWLFALVASAGAFATAPSAAARELYYAERPTRWFALSLMGLAPDADGDGFTRSVGFVAGEDCDDGDRKRNPRQPEVVGNGIDDHCFGGESKRSFRELLASRSVAREPTLPASNVLVLLLDSFRFDAKHATGIDPELTPFIAGLARESLVFTDYRTCSPRTLESFGDLFFGSLVPTFRGASAPGAIERLTSAGVHTVDISSRFRHEHDRISGWSREISIPGAYGEFGDAKSVTETVGVLRKDPPQPFFVATHLLGAHEPYEPLAGCVRTRQAYERYRCALRLLDQRVGAILAMLSETGLSEQTVVVVSADHGEEFGEHGARFHASTLYDEVLHVPLLVRIPGRGAELVHEPAGCFDFMPTLLGAANHALDPLLVGHDYTRGPRPTDRVQFARTRPLETRGLFEPKSLAVVRGSTKLLVDRQSGLRQYFDLRADPEERKPLARVDANTERALGEAMDAWLSELAQQSLPNERTASVKR